AAGWDTRPKPANLTNGHWLLPSRNPNADSFRSGFGKSRENNSSRCRFVLVPNDYSTKLATCRLESQGEADEIHADLLRIQRMGSGSAAGSEALGRYPRLHERMPKGGALHSTGGLAPSSAGAKVRVSGGNVVVTDGPFAETKEIVGGF